MALPPYSDQPTTHSIYSILLSIFFFQQTVSPESFQELLLEKRFLMIPCLAKVRWNPYAETKITKTRQFVVTKAHTAYVFFFVGGDGNRCLPSSSQY